MNITLLRQALRGRAALIEALHAEDTSCYRLLHGSQEGCPGWTLDRYGPLLRVQTFAEAPEATQLREVAEVVEEELALGLSLRWRHRGSAHQRPPLEPAPSQARWAKETGQEFRIDPDRQAQDPLFFLDFRAGRRWIREHSEGMKVLNLFAYTCTASLAAAAGGAAEVLSVDFSQTALDVGLEGAQRAGLDRKRMRFLRSDFFPAARQLAGLSVKGRGRRRSYPRLHPEQFDRVILDPPTWSKSPFGAVDILRDYASLFKPALLATRPGGQLLVTHHDLRLSWEDWTRGLERSARKAGRPLQDLQRLEPEADFPSRDHQRQLKMAILQV